MLVYNILISKDAKSDVQELGNVNMFYYTIPDLDSDSKVWCNLNFCKS